MYDFYRAEGAVNARERKCFWAPDKVGHTGDIACLFWAAATCIHAWVVLIVMDFTDSMNVMDFMKCMKFIESCEYTL